MPTETESPPLPRGAMAQVTRIGDDLVTEPRVRVGDRVIIEDYVSAEQSEDGVPFYWSTAVLGSGDVIVAAADVEQVMTPAEVEARRPPGLDALLPWLGSALLQGWPIGFSIDETAQREDSDTSVTAIGATADGVRFAVVIEVASCREVDW